MHTRLGLDLGDGRRIRLLQLEWCQQVERELQVFRHRGDDVFAHGQLVADRADLLVPQESLESPDHRGPQESLALQESLDHQDPQELLELQDLLVPPGLQESQDLQAPQVLQDQRVSPDRLGQAGLRESLGPQVKQDRLVLLGPQA